MIEAVVVGKGNVEGILAWGESFGEIAIAGVGVVKTAKVFLPILIPRGFIVGGGIFRCGFFANPKDSRGDVLFPRVGGAFLQLEDVTRSPFDCDFRLILSRDDSRT